MGQERLHVKKRRDGRHAEKERVLHTLPLNVPSLTMPLVLPIWRENKGQRSTPLFRLLVWLPCTHFIGPFQCPTHCKRHGEICFRALTPCSPPLNPPPAQHRGLWGHASNLIAVHFYQTESSFNVKTPPALMSDPSICQS